MLLCTFTVQILTLFFNVVNKFTNILLIDDDDISCYLHKSVLESLHQAEQVVCISTATQALEFLVDPTKAGLLQAPGKVLIFLDLNMPQMDGFDFLDEVRNSAGLDVSRLSIFMLASYVSQRDLLRADGYKDVLCGFLEKPLTETSLKEIWAQLE